MIASDLLCQKHQQNRQFNNFGQNVLGNISRSTIKIKNNKNTRRMTSVGKHSLKSSIYLTVVSCGNKMSN